MKKYSTEEERKEAKNRSKRKWANKNKIHLAEYKENNKQAILTYHNKYREDNREALLIQKGEYRRKIKIWVLGIKKQMGCQECGIKDIRILEFHHRDRAAKLFTIGNGLQHSKESISAELEKCDILCANCHLIREWEYKYRGIK